MRDIQYMYRRLHIVIVDCSVTQEWPALLMAESTPLVIWGEVALTQLIQPPTTWTTTTALPVGTASKSGASEPECLELMLEV